MRKFLFLSVSLALIAVAFFLDLWLQDRALAALVNRKWVLEAKGWGLLLGGLPVFGFFVLFGLGLGGFLGWVFGFSNARKSLDEAKSQAKAAEESAKAAESQANRLAWERIETALKEASQREAEAEAAIKRAEIRISEAQREAEAAEERERKATAKKTKAMAYNERKRRREGRTEVA